MRIVIVLILMVLLAGCGNRGDFVVEEEEDVPARNGTHSVAGGRNLTYEITKESQEDESEEVVLETQSLEPQPSDRESFDSEDSAQDLREIKLPRKVNLEVGFQSQAPTGNWDLPYQEACEEAVLILADRYFAKQGISKEEMEDAIKDLVEWQERQFGFYTDTSLDEVLRMAEGFYNLDVEISGDVTVERLKTELAKGNLIIAPTAGRMLGNPNFSGAGPIYHFVVVRGYDSNEFIVNDVGTRKGDGYEYRYKTLINAIYDLPFVDDEPMRFYEMDISDAEKERLMQTGEKKILIVKGYLD
jgi:hypothetical protein